MKSLRILLCSITAVLLAAEPLTNETVIRMVQAGVPSEVIVQTVRSTEAFKFSMLSGDLQALTEAHVPDEVIKAMAAKINHGPAGETKPAPTPAVVANSPAPAGLAFFAEPKNALVLQDATPVRLRLNRTLSSADARTGDTVDFEVLDNILVGEAVVIARGSSAIATITEAQAKRRMGRGGKLDLEIDYVRLADGEKVTLRAVKETRGGGHSGAVAGAVVASALIVWPAAPFFLLIHGKDTVIPKGTEITAYTNGEIKLDRLKFEKR